MNFKPLPSLIIVLLIGMISCVNKPQPETVALEGLIPKPVSLNATGETFELTTASSIFVEGQSADALRIGQYLADKLKPATGF
ncbi:MAG: beta-N-acetylhexosaminidase, partial [Bacteroidota bacterium]